MAGHSTGDLICLPEEPQWKNYTTNDIRYSATAYAIPYYLHGNDSSFFSTVNTGGRQLQSNPVPCAVCYVPQRSTSVMMPASTNCPVGWTQEYDGYIVANSVSGSSYICVDKAPEVTNGDSNSSYGVRVVKVQCGVLPCSTYLNYRELACVVCTK